MTTGEAPRKLVIRSSQWDYPVYFEDTINGALAHARASASHMVAVVDEQVHALHRAALAPLLSAVPTLTIRANEETKSLTGVEYLSRWLLAQGASKSTVVLGIGGGCIQDLVSFTCHIYHRGIHWRFVPTTILSQADSCIGAKSGINVLPFKNQLGTLHSPSVVCITPEFLSTLPELEVASGYGEIVKLSVTSGRHFLTELEAALADGGLRNPYLRQLTFASLAAKQEIIEEDEAEADLRRVLNYGHSFGHALEAISDHSVPHGLAVLWGIDLINSLGVKWGITDAAIASRLRDLIRDNFAYTLPVVPTAEQLMKQVSRDKKVANGLMHFAVLVREGEFVIDARALDGRVEADVAGYLESDYVFRRS